MRLLPFVFLAALTGCAAPPSSSVYPPTDVSDVVVYERAEDVPGTFEVLGYIDPPPSSGYGSRSQPREEARRQAAAMGANGLLVYEDDEAIADARIRQAVAQGRSARRGGFIAIYVSPTPDP